jgi:hypothetical protein
MHLDIIEVFYLPTDAQESCFKQSIKIYIETAPILLNHIAAFVFNNFSFVFF